ncbi:MAG: type II toxin-antitoxin system HicB family antitoxin [Terriglobia bacterium]
MRKYLIVIEKTETGYSAYSPDLDGCVSTGQTLEEAEKNMREAIEFHLESMRLEGISVSEPHTYSTYVEVPAW